MSSAYREGSPARAGAPVSPIEAYNALQPPQYQNYARAPPRRPVAPYARQAPAVSPPSAPQPAESYSAYRPRVYDAPEQDDYRAAPTHGAGAGAGAGAFAAGDAGPYSQHYEQQTSHPHQEFYDGPSGHSPPRDTYPRTESQDSSNPGNPFSSRNAVMTGPDSVGYRYGHDQSMPGGRQPYRGDGYDEFVDPHSIADDGDDGFQEPQRRTFGKFGAAGAGAAGGTVLNTFASRNASGNYGPVNNNAGSVEKSEWLANQGSRRKKWKWIVGIIIAVVVIGAVVAGVLVGVVFKKNSSSGSGRGSSSDSNGLWDLNSSEVQAVLNNKNLHKVFPGMDYTPLNAQYPDCLANPPYQNDVTLDVAVLSQMTPAIRLYGTDCDQTEMVLKGIDLLGYNETLKVWLGVWLADNSTTNTRQLNQMYDILDAYPSDHFAGVIVGNEVLFREDMPITQLASQLSKVRQELSSRGISLPVATSDLGDDWTAALAADSDIVMSNVHPFFAGVTPDEAPGWTWSFWQTHDAILKTSSTGKWPANIISETGWPSEGGNDCGTGKKCPSKNMGAIAGIDELNQFMEGWVCPSMANGTTYFW